MKYSLFALALVTSATCASAFAQSAPAAQPYLSTVAVASNVAPAPAQPWDAQPTTQMTRAQVYQQLVQAERDGQMQYLNSTVYAGN